MLFPSIADVAVLWTRTTRRKALGPGARPQRKHVLIEGAGRTGCLPAVSRQRTHCGTAGGPLSAGPQVPGRFMQTTDVRRADARAAPAAQQVDRAVAFDAGRSRPRPRWPGRRPVDRLPVREVSTLATSPHEPVPALASARDLASYSVMRRSQVACSDASSRATAVRAVTGHRR